MKQIKTDILVVGGGMSGLAAAWQLDLAGQDYLLIEGRDRIGGRVYTAGQAEGFDCDLGPSWFWNGQPLILSLLTHFQIPFFEQFSAGHVLVQHPDGQIQRFPGPSPMHGARRIEGGIGRLAQAIADEIPAERKLMSHSLTGLSLEDDQIIAAIDSEGQVLQIVTNHVALGMPPRLAGDLAWSPALPSETLYQLTDTPTWMAGHAKFFAVYERPFWREAGLCGSAMSRRGPLAEIHDASPRSETAFSLFGFVGIDAPTRARAGKEALIYLALQQLVALFGEEAGRPVETYLQDWSQEPMTASAADQQPQTRHPEYGLSPDWGEPWSGRVTLISSETSVQNGGLIEGALESGVRFAQQFRPPALDLTQDPPISHSASMDWDWIQRIQD